jgi:hypothetical protein
MALAVSSVVGIPRIALDVPRPRVAGDESRFTYAEPGPATQRTANDATWDIVEEWGRQSFPASDPPANW